MRPRCRERRESNVGRLRSRGSTAPVPQLWWSSGRMSRAGFRGEQLFVGSNVDSKPIVGPPRKHPIQETRDDSLPNRSGCRLQEMSGIFSLPAEKRHRRLPETRRHTNQAASGQRQEVAEIIEVGGGSAVEPAHAPGLRNLHHTWIRFSTAGQSMPPPVLSYNRSASAISSRPNCVSVSFTAGGTCLPSALETSACPEIANPATQ